MYFTDLPFLKFTVITVFLPISDFLTTNLLDFNSFTFDIISFFKLLFILVIIIIHFVSYLHCIKYVVCLVVILAITATPRTLALRNRC